MRSGPHATTAPAPTRGAADGGRGPRRRWSARPATGAAWGQQGHRVRQVGPWAAGAARPMRSQLDDLIRAASHSLLFSPPPSRPTRRYRNKHGGEVRPPRLYMRTQRRTEAAAAPDANRARQAAAVPAPARAAGLQAGGATAVAGRRAAADPDRAAAAGRPPAGLAHYFHHSGPGEMAVMLAAFARRVMVPPVQERAAAGHDALAGQLLLWEAAAGEGAQGAPA